MTSDKPTADRSDDPTDTTDSVDETIEVDGGADDASPLAAAEDIETSDAAAEDIETLDAAAEDIETSDAAADPTEAPEASETAQPDETTADAEPVEAAADAGLVEETTPDAEAESATTQDAEAAPRPAPPIPRPTPGPRPGPRPAPGPRPGAAKPAPRPAAARPPRRPAEAPPAETWGRVDEDGTVSVREGDDWRVVGQYPDGTPEEALAYYERKYADLAAEVRLLEDRHAAGASAQDLRSAADALRGRIVGAAAVGDLAALGARIDVVDGTLAERTKAESEAARAAVAAAVAERTALVERIEALAQRDPSTIQWKQTTADIQALFEEWQRQQQEQPRLSKSASQQLWKRFRDARAVLDKARREFYADLDAVHKTARDAKSRLVEQAEALAPRGEDGISSYRDLLDRWKSAGRAGKKADDALWARFKAAGDALYAARADRETADAEASKEKIELRRALLVEAKGVAAEKDLAKARALLTSIQRRWDDTGRIVPRETERSLDDDLRKIEQALRGREDADWKSNDPSTKARADDMSRQLEDAIAKLEAEVAAAKAKGDKAAEKKATEALAARRSWLGVLGR